MLELFNNSESFGGAEAFIKTVHTHIPSRLFVSPEIKNHFRDALSFKIGKKISKRSYDFYRFAKYRKYLHSLINKDSIIFTHFKKEQILFSHESFAPYKRFTFEHGPLNYLIKFHPLLWYQYKNAIKKYNKRFCGTLVTKRLLENDTGEEFIQIPYGIDYSSLWDESQRNNFRKNLHVNPNDLVITFADRPEKARGFDDLMDLLKTRAFPYKFWIFGSKTPKNFDSKNHVQFFGFVSNLMDYLHASDFFLNLSTAEGEAFPLRLLMALNAGNGIISCDGVFREEMESALPFEYILPRTRGELLKKSLQKSLEIIHQIPSPLKYQKNEFIKNRHSTESMIEKLRSELL